MSYAYNKSNIWHAEQTAHIQKVNLNIQVKNITYLAKPFPTQPLILKI